MHKFIMAMVFCLFATTVSADESFTLWGQDTTLTPPFTDGLVATSPVIANNSGTIYKSLEIVINYVDITPDQADSVPANFKLTAIVEGQVGGEWYPIAAQFDGYHNSDNGPLQTILLEPSAPDTNSVPVLVAVGNKIVAKQNYNQGVLGEKFRVSFYVDPNASAPLTSLTLRASGRMFNEQ